MGLLRDKYKFPLQTKWDVTQVDFVNPTNNPVTIDIFNPITLTNFPTSPNGTIYPSSVGSAVSIGSGSSRGCAFCNDNQFIYVADVTTPTVYVFDTTTNSFVTSIVIPSIIIGQFVYCSSNNMVYGGAAGGIHVIDCETNTYFSTIAVTFANPIIGVDYSETYNSIYCTQPATNTTYRISCDTNVLVNSVTLAGTAPRAVKYNPINDFVYVFPSGENSVVLELSPTSLSVISSTPFSSSSSVFGTCVFVTSNNSIYYQELSTNTIKQFDCSSLSINSNFITFTSVSLGLVYISDSNLIYAADNSTTSDSVKVYNAFDNSLFISVSTPIANFGDFANLIYNPVKNSIYEISSPVLGGIYTFEIGSTANFYISSPYNYNALLQDVQQNPMLIRRIDLICENQSRFTQPFNIVTRDANGMYVTLPKLPNVDVSMNQAQPNLVTINFEGKELILDDNTMFSQYTFPAESTTRIIVYYKQVKRIDIVTKGLSLLEEVEKNLWLQQTSVTEAELNQMSNVPVIIEQEDKKQQRLVAKIKYNEKLKTMLIK